MTIPLTENRLEWGFICGRVNVLETRLLSRDFFLTLIGHARVEDVLRQLQETPLQEFVAPGAGWQDWSAIADAFFHDRVASIGADSPQAQIAQLWLLSWDFVNLRAAFAGQTAPPLPCGMITPAQLAAATTGDVSSLPAAIRESLGPLSEGPGRAQDVPVDIVMDAAYVRALLAMAAELDVPLVSACARELAALRVIMVLWRASRLGQSLKTYQRHFLPLGDLTALGAELIAAGSDPKDWPKVVGGPLGEALTTALQESAEEQVSQFEQLGATHLASLAQEGEGQVFGPERVFSYIAALHREAHNLKLAVCGRLNNIDPNLLRRRLRERHG